MSRLKATQRGKAGKHRSKDTLRLSKKRAFRKVSVPNKTDRFLLVRLYDGTESTEPLGALAGPEK
jgi:hypothetical protein